MYNPDLFIERMKYARADYTAAEQLTAHYPVQLEIICYHCQQTGEKALKAILAYYDKQIPRAHNLNDLLQSCAAHDPKIMKKFILQADHITNFAVITRYPNEEMKVTEADMQLALMYANEILSYVEALIDG